MNRGRSEIGYDTEELYFHELNREQIRKIRATLEKEASEAKQPDGPEHDIPVLEDDEYSEAA